MSSIIIKVQKVRTRKLIEYTTLRKLCLNCHFIHKQISQWVQNCGTFELILGQRKCTQQNALTKTSFAHNIVSIQRKEQQLPDYITAPTSKNPLNYRVASFWG